MLPDPPALLLLHLPASAITNVNNIQLGVHIPALVPAQSYVFARIGAKNCQCGRPDFFTATNNTVLIEMIIRLFYFFRSEPKRIELK